jgi:hypothetical protein
VVAASSSTSAPIRRRWLLSRRIGWDMPPLIQVVNSGGGRKVTLWNFSHAKLSAQWGKLKMSSRKLGIWWV